MGCACISRRDTTQYRTAPRPPPISHSYHTVRTPLPFQSCLPSPGIFEAWFESVYTCISLDIAENVTTSWYDNFWCARSSYLGWQWITNFTTIPQVRFRFLEKFTTA